MLTIAYCAGAFLQREIISDSSLLMYILMPSSYLLSTLLALSISTSHGLPLVEDSATGIFTPGTLARSQSLKYTSDDGSLQKRADSATDICKRWSQQTAVVNGTMYIYGGRSTTDASQDDKTWSMLNHFLLF